MNLIRIHNLIWWLWVFNDHEYSIQTVNAQSSTCYDAFECVGQSASGYGIFFGYKSLFGPNSSCTTWSHYPVRCDGSHSCSQATLSVTNADINCMGFFSCVKSDLNYATSASTSNYCGGTYSCAECKIFRDIQHYCSGFISCYGLTSTNESYESDFDALGFLALDSAELWNSNVILRSHYGGYNGILVCENGYRCEITCLGTGCYGFQIDCRSGANHS